MLIGYERIDSFFIPFVLTNRSHKAREHGIYRNFCLRGYHLVSNKHSL